MNIENELKKNVNSLFLASFFVALVGATLFLSSEVSADPLECIPDVMDSIGGPGIILAPEEGLLLTKGEFLDYLLEAGPGPEDPVENVDPEETSRELTIEKVGFDEVTLEGQYVASLGPNAANPEETYFYLIGSNNVILDPNEPQTNHINLDCFPVDCNWVKCEYVCFNGQKVWGEKRCCRWRHPPDYQCGQCMDVNHWCSDW